MSFVHSLEHDLGASLLIIDGSDASIIGSILDVFIHPSAKITIGLFDDLVVEFLLIC